MVYNGASQLIAAGRTEEAFRQLQNAETQCRKYLAQEEGSTEDEINEEVAIIRYIFFMNFAYVFYIFFEN